MKHIISILSAIMLMLLQTPSRAGHGGTAMPHLAIDRNPASLASGGARLLNFSSLAGASSSNPSLIPFSQKTLDAGLSWQNWTPSETGWYSLGASVKAGNRFGVALGFDYGRSKGYEMVDENNNSLGTFNPVELTGSLGFSCRFADWLSAGANLRYATGKLSPDFSRGCFGADLFLTTVLDSGFKAALGVSQLGTPVKSVSGEKFSAPSSAAVAAGYEIKASGAHKIQAELDFRYFFAGSLDLSAGFEYCWKEKISARAGYHYGDMIPSFVSAGTGFCFKGVRLDFAWFTGFGGSPLSNGISAGLGYGF
ncbi:MAG: PorV/PorQ family protein [Bacteroidales bacterium]|nr:PorV/PorQ family protein [Bacteroidales bacterium]